MFIDSRIEKIEAHQSRARKYLVVGESAKVVALYLSTATSAYITMSSSERRRKIPRKGERTETYGGESPENDEDSWVEHQRQRRRHAAQAHAEAVLMSC